MTEIAESDGLKTLGQLRPDARMKKGSNFLKWSREGRPNPIAPFGSEEGGYDFTDKMLELALFAKTFANGPEDPWKRRHCFYCMLCKRTISMKSQGLFELKIQLQRDQQLRADQRFCAPYYPTKVTGSDGRVLIGSNLRAEKDLLTHSDVHDLELKRPFNQDAADGKWEAVYFYKKSARVSMQIEFLTIF